VKPVAKESIAACLIAHNEEEGLAGTLEALGWTDEIIVVDCGSTDGTARIARRFTDRIFERPNLSNLNVNKNFAFDQAASEWLLCLDADEVVTPALAKEIGMRTSSGPVENGFFLSRRNNWFGRVLLHGGQFPDRQLRLFRRGRGRFPERHVHERLAVEGKVGALSEPLDHFPYRSLSHYLAKMDFYTSFEAGRLLAGGRRFGAAGLVAALVRGKFRFLRRYFLKAGFLDGWQGFAAASLDLLSLIVVQLKLREMEERTTGSALES